MMPDPICKLRACQKTHAAAVETCRRRVSSWRVFRRNAALARMFFPGRGDDPPARLHEGRARGGDRACSA